MLHTPFPRRPSRGRITPGVVVALGVAVAVVMGVAVMRQPKHIGGMPPGAAATSSTPQAALDPTTPPPAAGPAPGTTAAPGVPPGVTAEQWAALQQEYAGQPDGPAQIARVVAFLQYRQEVQRFRALRDNPQADREALRASARALEAGLDERLARGEVSASEALQIRTATAEVLLPDATARKAAVADWQRALAARSAPAPQAGADEFRRREAEIVAAWQALPAAQRDPDALARQLQALRQQMFDPPGAQTPAPVPARGGS